MMGDAIVRVRQGQLQGKKCRTIHRKEYYSFSGIPYAKPPVGKLRFKDPVPPSRWSVILDATKEREPALQIDLVTKKIIGSDDCLYLNIHTPKLASKDPLPVIVYFHGGGFVIGSGSKQDLGPDFLIGKDVIFVTLNYRLGVMGFLCTDPKNARGDMGLKDQTMALKWVKENIKSFSGDPNNITIFGMSAGAASVEYHILSKMSSGLFHKAIIHSGSSMNPWARTENGVNLAMKLAKALGYESESTEGLFDFINTFESKNILKMVGTIYEIEDLKMGNLFLFTPVLDGFKDGKGFLADESAKLLKEGNFNKVPTISGTCDAEGSVLSKIYIEQAVMDIKAGKYDEYIPNYLKNVSDLEEKIDHVYKTPIRNPEDGMMDFVSDLTFVAGVLYSTELRMNHNPNEYLYQFCYPGNPNMTKTIIPTDKGASHGANAAYLGPSKYVDQTKATSEDLIVRENLITMLTNFAKTGNPSPLWSRLEKDSFNYLNIDVDLKMLKHLNVERRRLWRDIYDNMSQLCE